MHQYEIGVDKEIYNKVYENLFHSRNTKQNGEISLDDFLSNRHILFFELQSVNLSNTLPMIINGIIKLQLSFKKY